MEDKLPKISIITVCFNSSATIERTIKSVVSQNYPNLEYIIIDGSSKDNTLKIVSNYKDNITLLISEPDKGPFDAMNKGISKATGDLIGIINSDDWYEPGTLEFAGKLFHQDPSIDIIAGNMQFWEGERNAKLSLADSSRILKEMSLNHPTIFIKQQTYKLHGSFDLRYKLASDYELILRLFKAGCNFKVTDKVMANMSLKGMSDLQWKNSLHEALLIKLRYTNRLTAYAQYFEIYVKESLVRKLKELNLYGFYKKYKNFTGKMTGKGQRFNTSLKN